MNDLCRMLVAQAKQCHTASGGGLLLAIKGHLEGHAVYEGCQELWQATDAICHSQERLQRAERVVSACIEFDLIQPLPLHIMEPIHRWQEHLAAEQKKGD